MLTYCKKILWTYKDAFKRKKITVRTKFIQCKLFFKKLWSSNDLTCCYNSTFQNLIKSTHTHTHTHTKKKTITENLIKIHA